MTHIAMVGCAHVHVPGFIKAILARPEVRTKVVWDHDAARAAKRAGELAAQVVDDPAVIWTDKEIKAVVICCETNRHEELVRAAARRKKHVFVEKPLGMAARDAYAMAKVVEKAGVLFQTGYFMRGNPKHVFMREQIQGGALGKVTRIRASCCHSAALGGWFDTEWRWMADTAQAGCGALGDLGTHVLDIMVWMMGPVASVTGSVNAGTRRYGDTDETGEAMMEFANGAIGTLAGAWMDVANPLTLLVSGTQGHLAVINNQLYYTNAQVPGADGKAPWTNLPAAQHAGFELFLDAITGQTDAPLVTAREAAYRSAVMEAIYAGAARKKWVKPKDASAPPRRAGSGGDGSVIS